MFKKLLVLLGIVSIAGLAFNCHGHHSPEKRANWIVKKIASDLDLDDKQKAELNRIKTEILQKKKDLNIKMIPEEAVELFRADKVDEAKVNKVFESNSAKREEFRTFMTKKMIEFHAVLTPEQRNKFADKTLEIMKKHGNE